MDREHSDLNLDTEGQPPDKPKLPRKIIQLRRSSQKNHVRRMKTAKLAKQTNHDPSSLAQTVHNKTFRSFLQSSSSTAHSATKPVGAGKCPSSKERRGNSGMSETDEASACEGPGKELPSQEGTFECNICIDTAQDEVVTPCGHLFCWPCLQRWMEIRPHRQLCPVCKAVISKESVIHVYGRGASKQHPAREDSPRRPPVKRTKQRRPVRQAALAISLDETELHGSPRIGDSPLGNSSPSFASGRNRPGPIRGTRRSGENIYLLELLVCGALGVVVLLLSVLGIFWDEE